MWRRRNNGTGQLEFGGQQQRKKTNKSNVRMKIPHWRSLLCEIFCFVLCFKPNDWRKQTVLCGLEQLPVRAGAQWVLASGMVNASFLQGSDELAALGEVVIVMVEDSEEGIYSTTELQFCLPSVPRSEARPRHCSFLIWRLMDAFSIWWFGTFRFHAECRQPLPSWETSLFLFQSSTFTGSEF